jgi:hypothetical protein
MTPENNNQKRKNVEFGILLIGLFGLLIAFNHCGLDPQSNKLNRKLASSDLDQNLSTPTLPETLPNGNNTPAPEEMPSNNNDAIAEVVAIEVDVGIKDFEQILYTMSAVTGVPVTDPDIQNTYKTLSPQLPNDNSIKSFLSSNQVAITKLAAEFCNELVNSAELRLVIWPQLNFEVAPATALNTAGRQHLMERAINRFWGQGLLTTQEMNQQTQVLNELITNLVATASTNAAGTRLVAKGVCIATLAASGTLIF